MMISQIRPQTYVSSTPSARAAAPAAQQEAAAPSESVSLSGAAPRLDLAGVLAATAKEAASLATKLPEHVEGEVLVKLAPNASLDAMNDFAGDYGAQMIEKFDVPQNMFKAFNGELVHLKLPAGMSTAQAMAAMDKDPRVQYASSNDIMHTLGSAEPVIPNDLDSRLWGMNNTGQTGGTADADIDAPEAWSITTGKGAAENGPVIAVI
ncbi:MAG: hypothetical protein KC910_21385, partial [Candidatus Eremiobacteraeota bacterium]|nr:hypothetical protein [Candidatus Eremiobacteraeota bacterium]